MSIMLALFIDFTIEYDIELSVINTMLSLVSADIMYFSPLLNIGKFLKGII